MKKIVAFFRRLYYRRIFFKLYYNSVFKQGKDPEYAVWNAAEGVNAINKCFNEFLLREKEPSAEKKGKSEE